jgi:hypothetical protein
MLLSQVAVTDIKSCFTCLLMVQVPFKLYMLRTVPQ